MSNESDQMLEVEDDEDRQNRLQSILETLNSKGSSKSDIPIGAFDFADKKPHHIEPPKELLSRLQAFLPQMEASNATLAQQIEADPQSVDIENVADDEEIIEMNLGLGVFEDKSKRSKKRANSAEDSDDSMSDSDSSSSDDSDSSVSSCSTEIVTSNDSSPRRMKPLPKRLGTRPGIVMLDDSIDSQSPTSSSSQ